MATVTTNIQFQTNDNTWFSANASLVLLDGESAYHVDGRYKFGDGVTVLSALSFLGAGGGGGSQDLQSVTDLGSVTTNNVEANSFVKTGGVSTEFLKGDGTVDTNAYLTTESQTLQNVTDLGNTTTNDIQFDAGVGVLLDNTSRLREGTIDAGYGGAKGIAQICAVGYELKWESGTLYVMDGNGTHIRHSLYNFASVPGATEDISKGFLVGTRWSLDNGDVYVCTDNTITAAVWVLEASDFTSAEKTKLSGIATGAEVNVNADWNATSGDAEILNKPTIGVGNMTKAVYDVDNTGIVDNAEAIIIVGRNATGSTLRKGTIIYILGSTGNRPNFIKAQANSEATSAGTFGVIVNDIANNSDGNCCVLGYLDTLDTRTTATYPFTTDTLADGDTIYLSPTTAGYITNVKPSAPNHLVYLGKVTRTSPTNGTIIYRIQNGYELEELHNVAIASVANNEILTYETSTSLWKNKTVTTALGYTPENTTNKSDSYTASSSTTYSNTKALVDGLATKQDTLVSATNIKTVNSNSLLGSGNVSVGTILGTVGTTATLGTPVPYGSGVANTVTSSPFISIYNVGASSRIYLANTSASQVQAYGFNEGAQYSGIYRYGSALAISVVPGTSLPSAGVVNLYSGNNNNSPIYITGSPIIHGVGQTSTNVATRHDGTGWRVGTMADVHTANTLPFEVGGKAKFNSTLRLKGYTVATLPVGVEGDTAYVTDALAPTYLVAVVGGGAIKCTVFFNGTNWIT